MNKLIAILLLATLIPMAFAQKQQRVAPIYGDDDQANQMIRYISENLTLDIPEGKNTENINGSMRCKLTIDPTGKISEIQITKSVERWLDIVILEGLKKIPASPLWSATKSRELSRQLIFSFGNAGEYQKKQYGPNINATQAQINNTIDKWQKNLRDSLQKHWAAWDEKTQQDVKINMPLSPDRNKNPHVDLKTPPMKPSRSNLPNIEISLE